MKTADQFRDQSLEELDVAVREARKDIFELKCQRSATKKLEKPHLLRSKRRQVAQMLTIMREKQSN